MDTTSFITLSVQEDCTNCPNLTSFAYGSNNGGDVNFDDWGTVPLSPKSLCFFSFFFFFFFFFFCFFFLSLTNLH
jgi:hypothetical protein